MPLTFKELKEFTVQQLATLKKEYEPMRGKTISIDNAKKLSNMSSSIVAIWTWDNKTQINYYQYSGKKSYITLLLITTFS